MELYSSKFKQNESDESYELIHNEIEQTIDQLRLYELISELKDLLNRNISQSSPENTSRFEKMRNGFVKAQAQFRMYREKKRYSVHLKEKKREEAIEFEQKRAICESSHTNINSDINFNLLDIPAELAFIYSQLDERDNSKQRGNIVQLDSKAKLQRIKQKNELPADLNLFSFNKFLQIYIKDEWERVSTVIEKPFLLKSNFDDIQESLSIFKLILRCVHTNEYDSKRDKALVDFIIRKALDNPKLKDEILVQIINQTWADTKRQLEDESIKKAWRLMSYCLSSFAPSNILYKYLLNYSIVENEYESNEFKRFCHVKLSQTKDNDSYAPRAYPPTHLEWETNKNRSNMAVDVYYIKSAEKVQCEVNSWSTCDELCRQTLESLEIKEQNGWTLDLCLKNENGVEKNCELMSCEYLFDVISELETSDASSKSSYRKANYLMTTFKRESIAAGCNDLNTDDRLMYGSSINNSVGSITSLVRSKISNSLPSDEIGNYKNSLEEKNYEDTMYEGGREEEAANNSSFYDGGDVELEKIGYKNTEKLLSDLNQNLLNANKNVCFRFEPSNVSLKSVKLTKSSELGQENENMILTVQKPSKFENTKKILKATLSKCSKLNVRYVRKPTCLHSASRGSVTRNKKSRVKKLKNGSTTSGSLKAKRNKNKRRQQQKDSSTGSGSSSKEKIEIEMALGMKAETLQKGDTKNTIQAIPIPKNKHDLDQFLDSLFDRALESHSNLKKSMSKKMDQDYDHFINSIGNRYSLQFSSKFNENDEHMKLSARIKGGPIETNTSSEPASAKASSTFIKIYKSGHDSKKQSNIEKKSVVKLVKGQPAKTFTTFIPVPIRKPKIGDNMPPTRETNLNVTSVHVKPVLEKLNEHEKIAEVDEEYVKNIEIVLPTTADLQHSEIGEISPIRNAAKTIIKVENETFKSEIPISIPTVTNENNTMSQPICTEVAVTHCKVTKAQMSAVCQELLQSRAKTVRIGRVRWPPPLNPNETFENELQRRLEVQRKIHEEILSSMNDKKEENIGNADKLEALKALRYDLQKNYYSDLKTNLIFKQQINPNLIMSHPHQQMELSSNIVIIKGFAKGTSAVLHNQTKSPLIHVADTYASIPDQDSLMENFNELALDFNDKRQRSFSNINFNVSKGKILEFINNQFYTYANTKWALNLRKEVFSPNERLDTASAIDLIFMQIIRDFNSNDCVRISEHDRQKLVEFLDSRGLTVSFLYEQYKSFKVKFKKQLIEMAKDFWPLYFCRLFPIEGNSEYEMIGVSHAGIRFVNREKNCLNENLVPTQQYSLWEIREVTLPKENILNVILNTPDCKSILIKSNRAGQIKQMLESYLNELDKDTKYVLAIRDYKATNKDSTLLNFNKEDLIKLMESNCMSDGWLYGMLNDQQGMFPAEYVRAVNRLELCELHKNKASMKKKDERVTDTKPIEVKEQKIHVVNDFTEHVHVPEPLMNELCTEVVEENEVDALNNRQLASSDEASKTNSRESTKSNDTDLTTDGAELSKTTHSINNQFAEDKDKASSLIKSSNPSSSTCNEHHSMLEFAMMNFKQSIDKCSAIEKSKSKSKLLKGSTDILCKLRDTRLGSSNPREWTWKEYVELVKFSTTPIQTSLLKFSKSELANLAVKCFVEVMRFMGDYPLAKSQKDIDCIYFLLQNLHAHQELCDEVYCQLIKQTTNNKSSKPDSCMKGWRLMSILSSYFKPSDSFKPYLIKYIDNSACDTKRPHSNVAQYTLVSLKKTFTYGGRRNVPSQIELDAVTAGRISKRQLFILPGGMPVILNIRSYTVVQDCIDEIAEHLGLTNISSFEQLEFAIYYVVESERTARPLNRREYIFDIITELSKLNSQYNLIFKRVLWYSPLRFDSEYYVDMIYNQILPDYVDGLLLQFDLMTLAKDNNKLIKEIACLSSLVYRANNRTGLPGRKELKFILPVSLYRVREVKINHWLGLIIGFLKEYEALSILQAKTKFLDIIKSWPLFGSTFFNIKNIFDPRIRRDCQIAINKDGVFFLDKEKHIPLYSFPFNQVVSTRRFRAENKVQFVDLKCGDAMVQKVTRIETDQGNEISILIGQYIELINKVRNEHQVLKCENETEEHASSDQAKTDKPLVNA